MLSKAELARSAGLSVLTVDRIERGFPCRMSTARKLLQALDIPLQDAHTVWPEGVQV